MTRAAQEAQRQLAAGRPEEAERILHRALEQTPHDAELRMMLAHLIASLGRKEIAIAELQRAIEDAPEARPPRLLLARLANEVGLTPLAEQHARQLIERNPRDSEAWCALGFAKFVLGRRREAHAALQRAVLLSPEYATAHRNLAAVLCDQEDSEQALAEADAAMKFGANSPAVALIKARALMQLDRFEEAEAILTDILIASPIEIEYHRSLSQLRQLRGDADPLREFRDAALRSDASLALRLGFGDALRRIGDTDAAEAQLRVLIAELGRVPQLLSSLAAVLQEGSRMPEAHLLAREAHLAAPSDGVVAETFITTAIATGNAASALPIVERFRAAHPRDQRWITYRIDIARLQAEHAFDDWFEPRFVTRTFDLPPPKGFRDNAEFLAALTAVLAARHRQKHHPLDQSLRHGTQTSRNLLVRPEPVIAALLTSFADALAEYQREIARNIRPTVGPEETHPSLLRNGSAAALVGCWSVCLHRGGFHVNHIHPEGWLSSAYYVSVPAEVADESARAGWLKFGEPRFKVQGLEPLALVQPRPGRLVLFPSYLWHGTNPLQGDAPRMSVAFDALPQTEIC